MSEGYRFAINTLTEIDALYKNKEVRKVMTVENDHILQQCKAKLLKNMKGLAS